MAAQSRLDEIISRGSLLSEVTGEKFDVGMGGIFITMQRRRVAFFYRPAMRPGKAAIARCAGRNRFKSLQEIDRPGVKVIDNAGGTTEQFDRANLRRASIVPFAENTRIFESWR